MKLSGTDAGPANLAVDDRVVAEQPTRHRASQKTFVVGWLADLSPCSLIDGERDLPGTVRPSVGRLIDGRGGTW